MSNRNRHRNIALYENLNHTQRILVLNEGEEIEYEGRDTHCSSPECEVVLQKGDQAYRMDVEYAETRQSRTYIFCSNLCRRELAGDLRSDSERQRDFEYGLEEAKPSSDDEDEM